MPLPDERIGFNAEKMYVGKNAVEFWTATPYTETLPIGDPIEFAANAEIGTLEIEWENDEPKNGNEVTLKWTGPGTVTSGNLVIETTWNDLSQAQMQFRIWTF